MQPFSLRTVILLGGTLLLLCACGGSSDADSVAQNVPFTPVPTRPPPPLLCGKDPNLNADFPAFEECDINDTGACAPGESCVCCVCGGDQDLGDRTFTIANIPVTQFVNSFLQSNVGIAGSLAGDPLVLRAGHLVAPVNPMQPDPTECQASLELAQDAIFGFDALDTSTLCVKLFAQGSGGTVDCDGGTAHDVFLTQNSNGPGMETPPVITTSADQDGEGGAGAATLTLARLVTVRLPANYSTADCPSIDYDNPFAFDPAIARTDVIDVQNDAFTTRTAGGVIEMPSPERPTAVSVTADGNFRCGDWSEASQPGALVAPIPGLDTQIGDTINALLLREE